MSGRNGGGPPKPRKAPISVRESTPASTVLIRPAKLSRPISIRKAELPVTTTRTATLSTNDLSCALQLSIFCTSSKNSHAFRPSRAMALRCCWAMCRANQSVMRRMGWPMSRREFSSSNWTRRMEVGGMPSSRRSAMIWSWAVVLPTCRGPRTTTIGAISASRRRRICPTKCRRTGGCGGIGACSHQGFIRRKSATKSGGRSPAINEECCGFTSLSLHRRRCAAFRVAALRLYTPGTGSGFQITPAQTA